MSQDGLSPHDANVQPNMELIGGDATDAPTGKSALSRIIRGTVYGSVMLVATALLAISAVPELAQYASFLPGANKSSCSLGNGSCCALDPSKLIEESCPANTQAAAAEACGGCPLSRAALMTGKSACCQETGGTCPLTAATADSPDATDALAAIDAEAEQPIDVPVQPEPTHE